MTRIPRQRLPLGLGLALAAILAAGCVQVVKLVTIDLGSLSAVNGAAAAGKYVDLAAENKTYADNKDKFDNMDDVAVLGTFQNNAGAAVSGDVWIVQQPAGPTLLPDLAAVQAAGGVRMWSMTLGPNETRSVSWNDSARFMTGAGRSALKSELAGDARFALYVFGNTGTYDITVTNASVAVMIVTDVGP